MVNFADRLKQNGIKKRIINMVGVFVFTVLLAACEKRDWEILDFEAEKQESNVVLTTDPWTEPGAKEKGQTENPEQEEREETIEAPLPTPRMDREARKAVFTGSGYVSDVEERTVVIPGVKGTYYFLYLSDMHILVENEEVAEENRELVRKRATEFVTDGKTSNERFEHIVECANAADLDGVLFGGDMLDFLSVANAECMNAGLRKLEVPYLYVTADHDLECWWTTHSKEEQEVLRTGLNYEDVEVMDCGEFLIMGVSDSTSQTRPDALEHVQHVFALGRPVILMQHVPMDLGMDEELREYSRQLWDDRVLLWGDDTHYEADDVTQTYLDMICAPGSPVRAVFAGHLHVRHEGQLSDQIRQYLFHPAYTGEVAILKVCGSADTEE